MAFTPFNMMYFLIGFNVELDSHINDVIDLSSSATFSRRDLVVLFNFLFNLLRLILQYFGFVNIQYLADSAPKV